MKKNIAYLPIVCSCNKEIDLINILHPYELSELMN